jgi:hypothetical protein
MSIDPICAGTDNFSWTFGEFSSEFPEQPFKKAVKTIRAIPVFIGVFPSKISLS